MRKTGRVWKWISGTALAVVLLLVLVPQTARAEGSSVSTWGGLQTQLSNASEDSSNPTQITLTGDLTAGDSDTALVIPEDKYVTLDLNGHTIDRGLKNKDAVENGNVITVNGNLTLTDSSTDHTGKITGGNTTGNGGGVSVGWNSEFTMSGGTIDHCIAINDESCGGGVYVDNLGEFTMEGGTISGCEATNGGGVYVNSGTFNSGTFIMNGGSITNCSANSEGGGVYVYDGEFTMTDGTISGCSATGGYNSYGGGVCVNGGTFTMENGTISGCEATNGGGVYVNYGTFTMENGTINGCNVNGYGGGVYVNYGTFTMENSTISGCSASFSGGVYVFGGEFTMNDGTISGCSATDENSRGGGVYVDEGGKFTMNGGTISDCSASYGGGVYVCYGTFTMSGGTIESCSAHNDGGGVYVEVSTFQVSGSPVISGNMKGSTSANNVELGGKTISVNGALTSGAEIHVNAGKGDVVATGENYTLQASDADAFRSDRPSSLTAALDSDGTVKFFTPWGALRAKFNNASTVAGSPTRITLTGDVTADEGDSALLIPAGRYVTLDLNGNTIDRGLANKSAKDNGNVITVKGTLILKDSSTGHTGTLTGGNTTGYGGGVVVSGGTFTMNGGTISGCSADNYGGVCVDNGIFTMNNGMIKDCRAENGVGGGVGVSSGTFTMNGGTIDCCKAASGGGVYVSGGTFTMKGGTISDCTALSPANPPSGATCWIVGGGVFVSGGTFNMQGGIISACTALSPANHPSDVTYWISGGGVFVNGNSTFQVSGTPVIRDNKKDGNANNVVLNDGKTISVNGALSTGAELHINADKGTTVAQIGSPRTASLTETEAGYFKSDVDSNLLSGLNDAGQVILKAPLPALTGAANLTYNGTEQTPALTFEGATLTAGTDYTVSYKKVAGGTETAISGSLKDAGTYKAVAAGKGSYAGTSEASFTINRKAVTVGGIKAKNKVYDTTTTAELDCSGATFAGKADGDILTVSGTGTFENANAGKVKTVTISALTLGGDSKDNYELVGNDHQTTTTATITRATPEVTAPTASATYMENLANVGLNNPTGNLSGTWTWATDNGINLNETAVGAVGTHVFRAKFTPEDSTNYCETTMDVTVTVGKATPTLTIANFSAPYGHPVSVKSNCNSDGEVTYVFYKHDGGIKTNTEDGAETEGGPPRNAGKYNIVASVAETSNYFSREETLVDGCEITPAPNPAVLRSPVTVKRGSDYDLSGLVSSDAKGTVSFALKEPKNGYSLSGSTLTLANTTDDSCTITVTADGTVDGKSNYETFSGEITVNATDLLPQNSFGFADVAQEKTYGDGDFTVAATGAETGSNVTYSSGDPEVATVEADTGKVHILKAGETTIIATAGATATYASAAASYKLTVNPKPVTISGITAADMEYNADTAYQGMTLNTASAVIAGKLEQDDLTVSAIGMCDADVGKNKTVTISRITLGGSSAGNYTVDLDNSQQTTTINITKANIPDTAITAPTGKAGLVYTGLAQALVDAGTAQVRESEMRYALGTATTAPEDKLYSASIPTAVNAGTYYVWYMVKGGRNHNDSSSNGPVTVTIGKASGGTTINADAVELQKGDNIEASVNIRGYVGTGAVIKYGTSPQVTPDNDPGISITDIRVSNDKNNLTFNVSSENGGNAIITVTLTSDNYNSVTLTIPVKVQAKTTEVKFDPPSNVTSAVQSVEVKGLSDYTQNQNTPSGQPVKVVLEVKPVSTPVSTSGQTAENIKTAIDNKVTAIFSNVNSDNTGNTDNIKTEYLDIKVSKQVGSGSEVTIGDVEHILEIAVKYDLTGKFNPVVIREHEGQVTAFTKLDAQPGESNRTDGTFYIDEDLGFIYIYSRYFSTYSVAYATVNSHQVTLNANGGTMNLSSQTIVVADGNTLTLPVPTRSNYQFNGWRDGGTGEIYQGNNSVTITNAKTFTAQWTPINSGGSGTGTSTGGGSSYSAPATRDLLPAGGSFTFPKPTTYTVAKWTSSDSKIASVDKNGKVKAKKAGTITITAVPKVKKGETAPKAVTYTITIEKPVINGSTLRAKTGAKVTDFISGTSRLKPVSYQSSKTEVLSIDGNGVMTAKKNGKTTITVLYPDGGKVKATYTVKLPDLKEVSGKMSQGKTKKLTIRNKSDQIRMVSSNPSVAIVDESGRVTAKDPGTAIINLMVGSEVYDSCTVTVPAPAFKQNGASLKLKLKKTVTPAVLNRGTEVEIVSSNPAVLEIRGKKVKAVGPGTATITLKLHGKAYGTINVTVP